MKKFYVKMFNSIGCLIGEYETKARDEMDAVNKTINENYILLEKGDTFEIDDFTYTY